METLKNIVDKYLSEDTAVAAAQQVQPQQPAQNPQPQQPAQPDPNTQKRQQSVAKIEQMVAALQKELTLLKQI